MGALPQLTTLAGWFIAFAVIVGVPLVLPLLVVAVERIPRKEDAGKSLFDIMAESCRAYEENGLVGYGEGEGSAIEDLLTHAK